MSNHKINELDSIFEEAKLNDDLYEDNLYYDEDEDGYYDEDEDGYYDEDEDGYYDELDKFDNNQKYTFDDEGFCIENGVLIRYDGRDNKVRIPNSVKSINKYAFLKCYKIERIYIPSSVNSLPELVIYSDLDLMNNEYLHIVIYCASPNIVIENSNISRVAIYSGVNKFNFFKASDFTFFIKEDEVILTKYLGKKEKVVIPSKVNAFGRTYKVTTIGKNAFYSSDVNYVILSKNIEIIDCGAFSFCNNLVQIDIPVESKLRKIESDAFEYCENLEDIELPDSLEYIGESAFCKCKHFRNINIPNNVKYIGDYCYEGCIRLSNITFDSFSQLEHIGNRVFSNCYAIIDIDDIPGSVLYVGESAFSDCLANITVEDPSKIVNWHPKWIDRCFYDSRGNIYDYKW